MRIWRFTRIVTRSRVIFVWYNETLIATLDKISSQGQITSNSALNIKYSKWNYQKFTFTQKIFGPHSSYFKPNLLVVSSQRSDIYQPPRSSDLSPLYFFLCVRLKNRAYVNKPATTREVKEYRVDRYNCPRLEYTETDIYLFYLFNPFSFMNGVDGGSAGLSLTFSD